MRIAAIYDIHGNLPALEAVLHAINEKDVDVIVVGGDVIAGPLPVETLMLLQTVPVPTHFLLGNAESEVLRYIAGEEINALSERANEEARWVTQYLSPEHRQFLASWVQTVQLTTEEWGDILFCHGTPRSNIEIFTSMTPEEKLLPVFGNLPVPLVVCGHTHMQFDRTIGGIRVVNAGSVGMPFGRTGADWLILDAKIHFMHTDYNVEKAAQYIRQSNYPHADDFAENNVLQTPSAGKMLNMLAQMEIRQAGKILGEGMV